MKRFLAMILALITVLALAVPASADYASKIPATSCEVWCVMDAATGQILVEKGMDKQMFPASITKIMSCIIALENGDPEQLHTMSYDSCHSLPAGSTYIALTEEEVLKLDDLLYGMMVASANDAANGVAECIGGTAEQFVQMMNDKAKEIGAVNTHFVNANGLHDDNHYTTAYDMALITRYALNEVEGFRKYWSEDYHEIAPTNKQPETRFFGTQHSMFVTSDFYYEGCNGGKLGYTEEANHTSVTSAERDGKELICVTMNSQKYEKYEDTIALFDYCFDSFQTVTLSKRDLQGFKIPVYNGEKQVQEVLIYPDNGVDVLLHRQYTADDLHLYYDLPESYLFGETIAPTLRVSLEEPGSAMYQDLGAYPLQFSVIDLEDAVLDANSGLPVKERGKFWRILGSFFKWLFLITLALSVIFVLLILVVRARKKALRKKRRRSRNAMIAQAQRDAKVRSYTLNDEERRRTHTTGRSSSGRPKR